jgi:hypothetical protein
MQVLMEVAPRTLENDPILQLTQVEEGIEDQVPRGHDTQFTMPSKMVEYVPRLHVTHDSGEVRPVMVEKVPGGHLIQELIEVAPNELE